MFCICVLIVAAAAVYMVEAYIHTYYAIEYMHGAPLFFVLLAKYAAPVLFLLLCGYFVFRYREKRRDSEKPAQDKPENREEVYESNLRYRSNLDQHVGRRHWILMYLQMLTQYAALLSKYL